MNPHLSSGAGRPRPAALIVALIALLSLRAGTASARPEAEVSFRRSGSALDVLVDGARIASYVMRDEVIQRPHFAHLRSPDGVPLSRNHPPIEGQDRTDHADMHPGLWLGFGRLGGHDFWRNRRGALVVHERFDQAPRGGAREGSFAVINRYVAGGETVCTETCRYELFVRPWGVLLAIDSTLRPASGDLVFGDQQEMGLGVRVATPIAVAAGGRMLDDEGRENEAGIWGRPARWCDASGVVGGRRAGVTLMAHPGNFRPSRFHARDYGLLVANPFGVRDFSAGQESRVVVPRDGAMRLRFGVLLHAAPADRTLDLDTAWIDYVSTTGRRRVPQRTEDFSSDPEWDAVNTVPRPEDCVTTVQDFGYAASTRAGGEAGEIGGLVSRSLTPSSYARVIAPRTLEDRLEASGRFAVTASSGGSGVLFGWFNSASRGWRTPNSLVLRLDGEGNAFRVFFEYGTATWRTGGGQTFEGPYQTATDDLIPADGASHHWSLRYDPAGAGGRGEIVLVLDGRTHRAALGEGHRREGAVFDRFGLLNQMIAGGALEVWFDDVTVGGETERFEDDPGWEARGNRTRFLDCQVRPVHDFAHRPGGSRAGGEAGEIGGLVWRIESTRPQNAMAYGAPVESLSLDDRLTATGRLAMTNAAADSAVLIGWYNSRTAIGAPPDNFVGILVEGPSRAGHFVRPACGASDDRRAVLGEGPIIRPDGESHEWSIDAIPLESGLRIVSTLDGRSATLDLDAETVRGNAALDRFGVLSWHRGGHFVEVFLDDVVFTAGR